MQRALSTSIFNMLGVNPGSLSFSCLVLKILSALTPKVWELWRMSSVESSFAECSVEIGCLTASLSVC